MAFFNSLLGEDEPIPLTLLSGAADAHGVRLAYVSLYEQSRKVSLSPSGYQLCSKPSGNCISPETLAAGSVMNAYLRPISPGAWSSAGHYSGVLTLVTSEKPEGETAQLEVYRSTPDAWIGGGASILGGILLAWLISTWGRSRFNRDQLLLPAVALRARVATLAEIMQQAPSNVLPAGSQCLQELRALQDELSDGRLTTQRYIAPFYASAYSLATRTFDEYRKFLDAIDQRIIVLSYAIKSGLAVAWDQLAATPDPRAVTAVQSCVAAVDGVIVPPPGVPATLQAVAQVISVAVPKLQLALAALAGAGMRAGAKPLNAAPPAVQYDRLVLEMRFVSAAVWLATMVITTLTGIYILILPNLGFGSPQDYFGCILWGAGLPLGVQQLSQWTANTTATALGISVSK